MSEHLQIVPAKESRNKNLSIDAPLNENRQRSTSQGRKK